MVRSFTPATISFALAAVGALGASVPDGTWPESQGNVSYTEPYVVAAGEVFDGGMKTYDRSDITCEGQTESGSSTAVFKVEAGGTLKNVIIGTNQMEGVHCDDHDCTIENVWWEDVCEDALSIKGGDADSVSTVTGGGARYADDKVVQHNGYGTVVIDGFYAQEFGKLYRSCGTCGDRQRFVNVSNIYAVDPDVSIVTVNENYDDEAVLKNIYISASDDGYVICGWSEGNEDGEPTSLGDGIKDPLCQYSESDIHINKALPSSSGSSSTMTTTTTTTTSTTGSTDAAADSTAASADAETTTSYVSSSYGSTAASASSTTAESSYDESSAADEASSTYYTSSTASSAGSSTDYASSTTAESSYYESSSAASASSSSTTSTTTTSSTASSDAADDTSSYSEETTSSSAASASSYPTESSSTEDASTTSAASTSTEEIEDEADTTEAGSTEAGSTSDVDTTTSSTTDETTDETTTDTSTPSKCSVRRHRA